MILGTVDMGLLLLMNLIDSMLSKFLGNMIVLCIGFSPMMLPLIELHLYYAHCTLLKLNWHQ